MIPIRIIGYLLAFAYVATAVENIGKSSMRYFAQEAGKHQEQSFSLSKWNRKLHGFEPIRNKSR
jgi:hypothetical protein